MYKGVNKSELSPKQWMLHARYELALTVIELLGAVFFIVGSFFFLSEATMQAGTWLFIIGSFFFALRPMVKFVREYQLYENKDYENLVK